MSKPANQPPTANEWGKLRSDCARRGFSQSQITEAVGERINGRNRTEITKALRDWLKENAT